MSMEWRGGNHIVPVDFRDDHLPEPDDYYEQYSEWLCAQADLHICNGDDLIRHFEAATRFDEFLAGRDPANLLMDAVLKALP